MFVVKHRKIFFIIGIILVIASVFFIIYDGLNLSIDFTGGSSLEVSYSEGTPNRTEVEEAVEGVLGGGSIIRQTETGFSINTPFLEEGQHDELISALSLEGEYGEIKEDRLSSVGPVVGQELKKKAILAVSFVVLAIIIFIAFAFRKVSEPVSSWIYGLIAIVALGHDVLIPFGIFAFLGVTIGAQIDILFVTAILAILGYSVNDTIVVFDRVRENLAYNKSKGIQENFEETVGKSLSQVFNRSINTSLTTLFVLLALFFIGGDATKYFSLVLITGVIAGTYSSIFLASPLLVTFQKAFLARKNK